MIFCNNIFRSLDAIYTRIVEIQNSSRVDLDYIPELCKATSVYQKERFIFCDIRFICCTPYLTKNMILVL